MQVTVTERGHSDISVAEWNKLSAETAFWRLVEAKLITVDFPSSNKVRLSGTCYVGRATFSGISIDLKEKVDGALLSLIDEAASDAFRVQAIVSPRSDLGAAVVIIVAHYIDLLRAYASRGREFQYSRRSERSSLVGGRLDITKTLQLRARGLVHQLAFDRTIINQKTLKNRILLAAVAEIGRISNLVEIKPSLLSAARGLAMLFEDCRDIETLYGKRSELARESQRLADSPAERDQDLLSFAAVILEHASFDMGPTRKGTVPRSWFVNLETLFEAKVRSVLRLLLPGWGVSKGSIQNERRFVFATTNLHKADPDIVISSGGLTIVGDVKYKEWDNHADAGDLYQLLTHAVAFGARKSFLIFPHDKFVSRTLGATRDGVETWLFGINLQRISDDIASCLTEMGITNVSEEEEAPTA